MTGKEMKVREVMKFIDENNQLMEMYMTPAAGKEFQTMEIKFTRKQNPSYNSGKPTTPPVPAVKPDEKK